MAAKNPWTKYIVLLVIALMLLSINFLKNRKYEEKSEPIFTFDKTAVTEIKVTKDTLSVTLIKGDTSWVFAAPDTGEVNQNRTETFLKNLVVEGELTGYQTKNPDKYATYGITDDDATKIQLKLAGNKMRTVFVSRSKSNWAHDYIRYPDDPKVYITDKKIMYYFSERASFWRK